jgi:translation initiation factor IF-3
MKESYQKEGFVRVDFQIKVPTVRVVHDNKQLGVMPTNDARKMAQELGLNLVEVVATANPPVCNIVDFGKFKFEQKIKEKEKKRKQKLVAIPPKELKFRPFIDPHDLETKINQVKGFLLDGKKVQLVMQFFGARELSHKTEGMVLMKKIVEQLNEEGNLVNPLKFYGNNINCLFEPKK